MNEGAQHGTCTDKQAPIRETAGGIDENSWSNSGQRRRRDEIMPVLRNSMHRRERAMDWMIACRSFRGLRKAQAITRPENYFALELGTP